MPQGAKRCHDNAHPGRVQSRGLFVGELAEGEEKVMDFLLALEFEGEPFGEAG